MIKFDYQIVRDEGDEEKIYKPDKIPTELPNIVYIEGPNSSGKSTLLNILALAFCGLSGKVNLNNGLKTKLQSLIASDHQKLTFDVTLDHEGLELRIMSRKTNLNNKEIEVREKQDGKENPVTPETFLKKYNLIYDIPERPTERLEQLILEIQGSQLALGNKIGFFRSYIKHTIDAIRDARDPLKLTELQKSLDAETKDLAVLSEKVELTEKAINNFERYVLSKYLVDYTEHLEMLNNALVTKAKEQKKIERFGKKLTNEMQKAMQDIKIKIRELDEKYSTVTPLLKALIPAKEKNHLQLWEEIVIQEEILQPEVFDSLRIESSFFSRFLRNLGDQEKNKDAIEEATILIEIKKLLENYRTSSVIIPGIEKTIPDFIKLIEKKISSHHEVLTKKSNIEKTLNLLNEISELKTRIVRDDLPLYKQAIELQKKLQKELDSTESEDDGQEDELAKKIRQHENKVKYYKKECAKVDIDEHNAASIYFLLKSLNELKPYSVYTENQLLQKLESLREELLRLETERKKRQYTIELLVNETKRLESKEPHRYTDRLNDFEHLLVVVQRLEQKLKTKFSLFLTNLIEKKVVPSRATGEEMRYYEKVSGFLAQKVGYIFHIDRKYEVSKIDMLNKKIETVDGKFIMLNDLGTGQSQSAYLMGLLNTNDDRKIIALFDEVAMMDNNSLEPIYNKLKELYENKKLLCGIVVQKADQICVVGKC